LKEAEIDWESVRERLCHEENLDPNYEEPGTLVSTAHRAAFAGETEVLRWCLRAGFNVNARTAIGRSALHCACNANKPGCIRLLLEHKADVNIVTLSGQTPLHMCCIYGSYEAVLDLLHGSSQIVDIDAEDSKRRIPEALTENRMITRAIRKYRGTFDSRRKADLVEQALIRIFCLVGGVGSNSTPATPKEFAESRAKLQQHMPACADQRIRSALRAADGGASFEEFKAKQLELISAQAVDFRAYVQYLSELETTIFQEMLGSGGHAPAEGTPRSKEAAQRRLTRPLLASARAIVGMQSLLPRACEGGPPQRPGDLKTPRRLGALSRPGTPRASAPGTPRELGSCHRTVDPATPRRVVDLRLPLAACKSSF